jgi:signal recognition particle subunit SRP72
LPAFKTLLFLLLQTDQYPLALSSFTSYPQITLSSSNPEKGFLFEKAYCLYRLHRELEALGLIDKELGGREGYESEEGRKVGHLRGQIVGFCLLSVVSLGWGWTVADRIWGSLGS